MFSRGMSPSLLPDTMPAKGHEVIHLVVRLGDAAEDLGDALRLLGLGDRLEAEVRRLRQANGPLAKVNGTHSTAPASPSVT